VAGFAVLAGDGFSFGLVSRSIGVGGPRVRAMKEVER